MTEPGGMATTVEEIVPGVWRWALLDDRIGSESDAHAVAAEGGKVLIDPLPLERSTAAGLAPVTAICLTASCHQRSAWRYRKAFGAKVYAPRDAPPTEEEPDLRYGDGDALPGGLRAVHVPGPEAAHYAFLRAEAPGVLFCPDLLMRDDDGVLTLIPAAWHDDPAATRESVRRLLDLDFSVLCLDHGAPVLENPHDALRDALAHDAGG